MWENFVGDNNITIKQSVSNQPKCKDLLVARLQEVLVVYKNIKPQGVWSVPCQDQHTVICKVPNV